MVSVIPFEKKDQFVNKQFIVEHSAPAGLVRIAGVNNIIPVQGETWQTIDFDGDFALFNDIESTTASAEENSKKLTSTASNNSITFMPLTQYYGQRIPRRFLEITTGGAYGQRFTTGQWLNANSPQSAWAALKRNPDLMPYLDALQNDVNDGIGRAIDQEAIWGVNPKTRNKSGLIGDNYIMNNAGNSFANRQITWDASGVTTAGNSAASDVFRKAVRALSTMDKPDFDLQGIETGVYNGFLSDEKYSDGTPGRYANSVPLIGTSSAVEGIQLAMTPTLQDTQSSTASGLPATTVVDAVLGNFARRFRWGFEIIGNGIEVFDSGNPDGSAKGDLAMNNEVYLRVEARLGWGMIGGYDRLRVITHERTAAGLSLEDDAPKSAKASK